MDPARDRAAGGMGIGLFLAKKLVDMHHGTIAASSAGLGNGSIFTVRLPVLQRVRSGMQRAPRSGPGSLGAPRRILLVDDHVDLAESMGELLGINRGAEALEIAAEFVPDTVILDIDMPEMDGYELARRLRQGESSAKAHLIALSGYGIADDDDHPAQAGFDRKLVKPVRLADLRKVLDCSSAIARS